MFLVDISGYVPKPKDNAIFLTRTDKKVNWLYLESKEEH